MSAVDLLGDYKETYFLVGSEQHTMYINITALSKCSMCSKHAVYLVILYDTRDNAVDKDTFCEECTKLTVCYAQKISHTNGPVVTSAGKGEAARITKENSKA